MPLTKTDLSEHLYEQAELNNREAKEMVESLLSGNFRLPGARRGGEVVLDSAISVCVTKQSVLDVIRKQATQIMAMNSEILVMGQMMGHTRIQKNKNPQSFALCGFLF